MDTKQHYYDGTHTNLVKALDQLHLTAAALVIDTDEEGPTDLHVVGINWQVLCSRDGMAGSFLLSCMYDLSWGFHTAWIRWRHQLGCV